ncbi:MAG TPA: carboxypeptidase regulatory-like domain-containing protein [Pyrinomonadaceae bacterium]|nr:carboxypeptidase regulatory-like domain-containing protein [Pyrinomonadaceae bacterium]
MKSICRKSLGIGLVALLSAVFIFAQQTRGSLRGLITDELGAAIVGATVTITDANGSQRNTATNGEGVYQFSGLPAGKYFVQASAEGFSFEESEVELGAGRETFDIVLRVTIEERVTVAAETPLSTEATNNANQTLITGKDLDALPDDPEELAAALQALAGPSVGPNGGQIFIDGFSGGRMPPREAIREIRINQNPFAAENDQPSGRIEILTRPGSDRFRGSSFFNFEDESLNSRHPFSESRTPFQVRQYGGNFGGPIVKGKASFFFDFHRRETDDNDIITATILDPNLDRVNLGFGVVVPRRNLSFSPRFDYQINQNNTLIGRYSYSRSSTLNAGIGNFSLPERAYEMGNHQHTFQFTETAVLNSSMINEVRFQFTRQVSERLGDSSIPTLNVSSAFIGGGSQVGQVFNTESRWELQDFVSWQKGNHSLKFGGRMRGVRLTDSNANNFGGTYVFTGGFVPVLDANNQPVAGAAPVFVDSLERYRRTLLGQRLGLTPLEIRAIGGGPSQFSISAGNPEASINQIDLGVYAQDDWRVRPNLTFSYGLRYENQSNISSNFNLAPRAAFAWSPGAADSTRPPQMVIRGGGGIFYNRFSENSTLQAIRFDGARQQQFFISESPLFQNGVFVPPQASPLDVFPNLPPLAGLTAARQVTWRVDEDLQAPTVYLGGIQVERQLPHRFTVYSGFYTIHIRNVIRARNINAPLPGTLTPGNPGGDRPFGNVGEIYQYESTGRFDQNQWFVGFNNRFNRMISFSSSYSLSKTQNDTDGLFPANSFDLSGEYGRAAFDVRHRFNFFGTINLPWWNVSLNPLVFISSGRPFNITTGQDTNGDRLFTERPSFAPEGIDCNNPPVNIVCTPFGNFNLRPATGEPMIPRNFGEGPGSVSVNLRISKTWSFGSLPSNRESSAGQDGGGPGGAGRVGPRGGIPGGGGGGRGGAVVRGGGGGRGFSPGGTAEAKRYSMQFSVNFQNLLNRVNLSPPEGNLSSPFFGQSLSLSGGFGGFGGFGGGSGGNRRVTAQVRFNF